MLLALALMGQDLPLNAEATQAIGCGRAVMASSAKGQRPSATAMLQTVYFMMSAADADPGTKKRYADRVTEIAPQVFTGPDLTREQAGATLAACDTRFPLWRGTAPAKLPVKGFDRDIMCASSIAYAYGFLQSLGAAEGGADYRRLLNGFMARIPDSLLRQHGIVDQETTNTALETALRGSLRAGNLEAITTACARELDGK